MRQKAAQGKSGRRGRRTPAASVVSGARVSPRGAVRCRRLSVRSCQVLPQAGVFTPMLLALLLVMQGGPTRETSPVLQFPPPGLDHPAAHAVYTARLFRDSGRNS